MNFSEWLKIGLDSNFVSPMFDWLQSGPELSDKELALIEDGVEPEILCIRIYSKGK